MGKMLQELTPELQAFIEEQKIFFVGTAAADGRINVSPKGMDTLRVLESDKLIWLNLTGSGNETAAHLLKKNRMTIMFCSFEDKPLILRIYGKARIYHQVDAEFKKFISSFPEIAGSRQIIEMQIDSVQTSCGFAVPFFEFKAERTQLQSWAEKQGEKRLQNYRKEKNVVSIDGYETNLPDT